MPDEVPSSPAPIVGKFEDLPDRMKFALKARKRESEILMDLKPEALEMGIGLTRQQTEALAREGITPRQLFKEADRQARYELTHDVLFFVPGEKHDFLYDEVPKRLKHRLFTFHRGAELDDPPENDVEEEAWFVLLNEAYTIATEHNAGTNPLLN